MEYIEALSLLAPNTRDSAMSDFEGGRDINRKGRRGKKGNRDVEEEVSRHRKDREQMRKQFEDMDIHRPDFESELHPDHHEPHVFDPDHPEGGQEGPDPEREKKMAERLKENLRRRKADYHKRIDRAESKESSISKEDADLLRKDVDELFRLEDQLHENRLELTKYFDDIRSVTNFEDRVSKLENVRKSREATRARDEETRKNIRLLRSSIEEKLRAADRLGRRNPRESEL
jgi:hypothetical protein